MESNKYTHDHDLLTKLIAIEYKRLHDLVEQVDRIDQDSTDISVDLEAGEILGTLSDAARAARYAIRQKLILKGVEDPGWGF